VDCRTNARDLDTVRGFQEACLWLYVQRCFAEDSSRKPKPKAKTVRVRVPRRQVVTRMAIRKMRAYKQEILEQLEGVIDYD
jgi:hypothetical protein